MIIALFVVYLLFFGRLASQVLNKFFGVVSNFFGLMLGAFAVFVSLGTLAGMAVLFLPLNFWVLAGVYILNAGIYIMLARWANKLGEEYPVVDFETESKFDYREKFASLAFLLLVGYGLYLLFSSSTGRAVLSPWQTIDSQYVFIFFFSLLVLGALIFTKLKTSTIIFFLILQTFLLHNYLPLTHKLIYGADGWRHIANEQRILEGKSFLQAKLSGAKDQVSENEIFKSKIGQLSYSNFWATNVILAKVFNADLLTITKWFLPILWSLIFPVLLYEIALAFGWSRKKSLLFSWLGLLPFAWASAGSFSLPVNYGLLVWLFLFLLILKRTFLPRREQKTILIVAGIGLAFGYVLYFILFWVVWGVVEFLSLQSAKYINIKKLISILVIASVIPALELAAGYGSFDKNINWLGQIKQLLGNFSAFYLASGPRPHDIATGNIIFNQTPLSAFIPNLITQWPWWLVVFSLCFFVVAIYGLIKTYRDSSVVGEWLAVVAPGIMLGYIISNYFLFGSHILARRLDGVLVLFLMLLFFYGLTKIYEKLPRFAGSLQILAIMVLSVGITASYSLGPDTNTVSVGQYEAVSYIWSQEQLSEKPCVMGDTFPLLALEAVSAKQIIGGGFPIDANFGQPERVELFEQMNVAINDNLLERVGDLTGASHCWFVGSAENFQKQNILKPENTFGDSAIIRYNIIKS